MMITPEAGCGVMLDNLGKGFSMKEVNACLDLARNSGRKSLWFFMLGGPGETMETCEKSIQYAQTRLTGNQFAYYSGTPSTISANPDRAMAVSSRSMPRP